MARNGSGSYSLPAGNPVVTNTTISSTWANNTLNDIATALTQSIAKDGQTVPTANLPMGGFKFTGLGAGTGTGDSLRYDQLFSQGNPTDIASAATVDIGSLFTNFINITGTTTITSFGTNYNGPKMVKFTGSLLITYNATTLVTPGNTNITTAAGDTCIIIPKSTVSGTANGWQIIAYNVSATALQTQTYTAFTTGGTSSAFTLTPNPPTTANVVNQRFRVKLNAAPTGSPTLAVSGQTAVNFKYYDSTGTKQFITSAVAPINWIADVEYDGTDWVMLQTLPPASTEKIQPITASVGSNALTVTLNPTLLDFRSSTLTSGTVNTRSVSAAISVTVSSGSTLGTANNVAARLVVIAIDNAGTVELAIANLAGQPYLDETGLISTTAEGGAGAADSATVIYSTTARTNVPYRVVGFIDITQATAGTWASAPTVIQGYGGNATPILPNIKQGVSVTTSGATAFDFTGIPTGVKRITANLTNVSTNGTSAIIIQLGSGSPTTSGYTGTTATIISTPATGAVNLSSGFIIGASISAASLLNGSLILTNITGNTWAGAGVVGRGNEARCDYVGGAVPLAGVIDRIRLTAANGTDSFDGGTLSITWEF